MASVMGAGSRPYMDRAENARSQDTDAEEVFRGL